MIIRIDGKECACEKGEFLLAIARRNGITIPTLCQHDSIEEGMGACRLCIVEITDRGRKSVVVSCVYPVTGEIEVETNSEKIQRERAMILSLLSKRAPESPEIARMCRYYKVPDIDRFLSVDGEKCVMCGLCAKVCGSLSVGAISTVNRGITKAISTPYGDPVRCERCGEVIGTPEQIAEAAKRSGNEPECLCDNCRKERMARVMAGTYGIEVV